MRNAFCYKTFILTSLMFCIFSMVSHSETIRDKGNNFKVWVVGSEDYSCTKYKDIEKCTDKTRQVEDGEEEYNCRLVEDYEDKKVCKDVKKVRTVPGEKICKNVKKTRKVPGKEKCVTQPKSCAAGGDEEYDCQTIRYFNPSCRKSSENDTAGCWETKRKCKTRWVCNVPIPESKHCTRGPETIETYTEKECKRGKSKKETYTEQSCTIKKELIGYHRVCDKKTKYKTETYRDCETEKESYYGTCSRDTSHWEEYRNNVINKFNLLPVIYKDSKLTIEDIEKNSSSIINIEKQPDSSSLGEKTYEIIVNINGDKKKLQGVALVVDKPGLEYKDVRTGMLDTTVEVEDVVNDIIISTKYFTKDRYTVEILNKVDTSYIGEKIVELKVRDKIKNIEFTGYQTNIKIQEKMKDIKWKQPIEIYVDDKVNNDTVIEEKNLPKDYIISLEQPKSPGNSIKVNVKSVTKINLGNSLFSAFNINPITKSEWVVGVKATILPKPKLKYEKLEILQNSKYLEKYAKDSMKNMSVDLNEKFPNRYEIKYKTVSDISKVGKIDFVYTILDTVKNREFDAVATVNVLEEKLNIELIKTKEYLIGEMPNIDDLIKGLDKTKYDATITNLDKLEIEKDGKKKIEITIKSKETDKEFKYSIEAVWKKEIVDLGTLKWEQYVNLNIVRIIKIYSNMLTKEYDISNIKPVGEINTNVIAIVDVELKMQKKNGGYKIAKLKVEIVENKLLDDIDKIVSSDNVYISSELTRNSARIEERLNDAYKNKFWLDLIGNYSKVFSKDNKEYEFGARLGYDKLLSNKKTLLGAYIGYDKKKHIITDKSDEHISTITAYVGHNINSKLSVGMQLSYTNIYGNINIKNAMEKVDRYNRLSHNILANAFLSYKKKFLDNLYILTTIGDTLLFDFSDEIDNKYDTIAIYPNLANNIYASIKVNKKINSRVDIYAKLKTNLYIGNHKLTLNNEYVRTSGIKNNIQGAFDIYLGSDIKVNDNYKMAISSNLGFSTKKMLNVGAVLSFDYVFGKNKIVEQKSIVKIKLKDKVNFKLGENINVKHFIIEYNPDKYVYKIENKDKINKDKAGEYRVVISVLDKTNYKKVVLNSKAIYNKLDGAKLIVYFSQDSYKLTDGEKTKINKFVRNLKDKKILNLSVMGRTDTISSNVLREKRRKVVYEYITNILKEQKNMVKGKPKLAPKKQHKNASVEVNVAY